jgi:uncharacterized membrane protein
LAVGIVRGWAGALGGAAAALALLLASAASLGPALLLVPLAAVQLTVGVLALLFGLRWLRKAVLRAAGVIPLHDEAVAFENERRAMQGLGPVRSGFDLAAFVAAFKITLLEGVEVVFIVIAMGAGGPQKLIAASAGAASALLAVILLGVTLHRPLAMVPENSLKFVVGGLLSAFGTFWVGEGLGLTWPGGDLALLGLAAGYLLTAYVAIGPCRSRQLAAAA